MEVCDIKYRCLCCGWEGFRSSMREENYDDIKGREVYSPAFQCPDCKTWQDLEDMQEMR